MGEIRWNELKSKRLKRVRGVSFEELLTGELVGDKRHHSRPNQSIMLILYKAYIWVVPYVKDEEGNIFLKTLFRSRKHMRLYKRGEI